MSRWNRIILLVSTLGLAAGCNLVSGAAGIEIADDDADDDGTGAGLPGVGGGTNDPVTVGGGDVGSGAGAGTGGAPGVGAGPSAGSGAGGAPTNLVPADGVSISRISVYQGVERPVMANGAVASSVAPVVADRGALIRVFYTTDGSFDGGPVTARLVLSSGPALETQVQLTGTSSPANLASTINFDVDRTMMQPGTTYRVELLQGSGSGTNASATYPAQGQADLEVESGGKLKITIVPIQYNGDGSGRLPDTSAAQLQLLEDAFFAMYPVTSIQMSVRSTVAWSGAVSANGNGWSAMLNGLADLRQNDNAPTDEYYYGVFQPASSHTAFCGGNACIGGLGFTAPANSPYHRAAIGLGYTGDTYVDFAVHEVGHLHGRGHAPCNTSGTDTGFPYPDGGLGVWGYHLLDGNLVSPSNHRDMMGYCKPRWISDYNFANLFDRIEIVDNASIYTPPELANLTWDRVLIAPDGTASPAGALQLGHPPLGEPVAVTVQSKAGVSQVTGQLLRYDHVEGGLLFVPPTSAGPKLIQAPMDGAQVNVWVP